MSRVYLRIVNACEPFVPKTLRPFWEHPAGPRTIHFWAPAFKWGLVIASVGDLARPADHLSLSQSSALAATGIIWMKYSLSILPKNWNLFSVNVFIATTSVYQIGRILKYKYARESINVH